jgi:hypothetical protein
MMVGCHDVPKKVLNSFVSPFDEELTDGRFKLGFEYHSRQDVFTERINVRGKIIDIFKQMLIPLNVSILDRFLFSQIKEQPAFKIMIPHGHYYVTDITNKEGTRWIYCEEMYGDPPAKIYFWQGHYSGICDIVHNNIMPATDIR